MIIRKKYMMTLIFIFIVELYIGLFVRDKFIRPFIGDVLVVILLYVFIRTFFTPRTKLLPVYIFIVAALVEIGQYFNILKIFNLESNNFVRIIFGATFDIKDIICYFVGGLLLMIWQEIENGYLKKL